MARFDLGPAYLLFLCLLAAGDLYCLAVIRLAVVLTMARMLRGDLV